MRKLPASCLAAALCATLGAQGTVTSPEVLTDTDGVSNSSYPFSRTSSRFQQTMTDLKGTPRSFKSLGFRPDAPYHCNSCTARKVDVEIVMAHTDITKTGTTFANNYVGTPTTVFPKATVSLPARKGPYPKSPAPPDFMFPFSKPFDFDGKQDFLIDVKVWNNTGSGSYYTDYAGLRNYSIRKSSGTGCTAAGQTNPMTIASLTSSEINSGKQVFRLYWYTNYGAKNAPSVTLIGTADPNQQVAGLCANLRTNALVDVPKTSSSTGYFNTRDDQGNYVYVPYDKNFVGTTLHTQSASVDASQPGIPVAVSNGIATTLTGAIPFAKRVQHFSDGNATVGAGPYGNQLVVVFGY